MKTGYFIFAILLFFALFALAFYTVLFDKGPDFSLDTDPGPPTGPGRAYKPFRVTAAHPRIFFNKRRLRGKNGIWRHISPEGAAHRDFLTIKKWCDANLKKSFHIKSDYNSAIRLFAFASVMDVNNTTYARKALETAEKLIRDDDGRNPAFDTDNFVLSLCLVLDWCYEKITPADRSLLAQDIAKRATWLSEVKFSRTPSLAEPLDSFFAIGYAGLAISGERGFNQTSAAFLARFRSAVADNYLGRCEKAGADGSLAEYSIVETANIESLIQAILAWQTTTEEDFLHSKLIDADQKPYIGSRFFQGLARYLHYAIRPDGRNVKLDGDGVRLPAMAPRAFYILAAAYGDPASVFLGDRMSSCIASKRPASDTTGRGETLALWRIIARPPVSANFHSPNIHRLWATFNNDRLAFYKYNPGPSALHLAMLTGRRDNRKNTPTGHFELSRGQDTLLTSSGTFEASSSHSKFFRGRRFAYNVVVPASPEDTKDWDSLAAFTPASPETINAEGVFIDGKDDVFFATVAWKLWIKGKLVMINRRSLLALGKKAVIIYDQAETKLPNLKKRFVLHTNAPFRFIGSESMRGGDDKYLSAVSVDASAAIMKAGDSTLFVNFLLPVERIIRRFGGKRNIFNIEGNDYTPDEMPRGAMANFEDLALWRLDLEAATTKPKADFLVVLAPREKDAPYLLKTQLTKTKAYYQLKVTEGEWKAQINFERKTGRATVIYNKKNYTF